MEVTRCSVTSCCCRDLATGSGFKLNITNHVTGGGNDDDHRYRVQVIIHFYFEGDRISGAYASLLLTNQPTALVV